MLNNHDKNLILEKLPKINLEYDQIIYKKVFDVIDYYILIPDGKRSLLWFTHYKKEFLSILLILDKSNKIIDLEILQCCFFRKFSYRKYNFIRKFFSYSK